MSEAVSTTPSRRIDEIGEESRRRILDAAEQLFAEKGFERTSFVDIAKLSGISRGSIPWHFKNKDGLLLAVVDRVRSRYVSLDRLSDNPSMSEILGKLSELTRDTGGRLMFAVLTEAMSSTGLVHEEYKAHLALQRRHIANWLKFKGVKSAAQRAALATALLGSATGVAMQWQIDPENVDMDAAFKAIASMVHGYLDI